MAKAFKFDINITKDIGKLIKKQSDKAMNDGLNVAAIAMLDWFNNGSPNSSATPPIRFGVLRASSSAFVKGVIAKVNPQNVRSGADESPTPARSGSSKSKDIEIVWNTPYAAVMHEDHYNPGPFSEQAGNAGRKWGEKHLASDGPLIAAEIAREMKKDL